MDSSQLTSIILFIICILLSAYFSSSETAFTSLSKIRLKNEAKDGDKRAGETMKLQEKFEALLSTVLIGNNLVNIAGSAIATVFFVNLFPRYGATIATIATTVLLLLFSEIAPKLLAKLAPERVAKLSTPILKLLMFLFKPLVWLLSQWQQFVKKLVPVGATQSISEEELLSLVDEAQMEGSIEYDERRLVKAAIEFDDVDVSSILTPRVDVMGIDIEESDEKIEQVFEQNVYSRLIVYEETIDNVIGVLHEKNFHRYLRVKTRKDSKVPTIESLLSEVLFVPPTMKLSDLLKMMQRDKNHMAVVVDEYGGTLGVATMEDALEELVGEIWDETDVVQKEVEVVEEGKTYKIKGSYSLDKMFDLFNIHTNEEWLSNTVSGFVIEQLEKVPATNDSFVFDHLYFTVLNAQNRRVNEVLIEKLPFDEDSKK
ncbi:MAG: hemolysin family protein [Tetragenococcus sp.]|nr:hemolysin family protein [Tetragenococcus sp.]